MSRQFCLIALIVGLFSGLLFSSAPKAEAIDPVTIAILAPFAIKAAQIMSPYIIKGLKNMGIASLKTLPDFVNIFKLPVGLGLLILGWPFGGLAKGVTYTIQGFIAPFKLCFHVIMIPVAAFGVNVN